MLRLDTEIPPAQIVKQALALLGSGDIDGYLSFFTQDALLNSYCAEPLSFGGQYRGHEALLAHYRQRPRQIPLSGMKWNISLSSGEDFVLYGLAEYSLQGGRLSTAGTMALWYSVRNGRICEISVFTDSSALHRLLADGTSLTQNGEEEQFTSAVKSSLGHIGELAGAPREDFSSLLELYRPDTALRRSDLADFLDPQVQWTSPTTRCLPLAAKSSGKDEVTSHFQIFDDAFEVIRLVPVRSAQAEDTLVIQAEIDLRCRESGSVVSLPCFQALTMRDGRIVRGFESSDTLRIDQCLLGPLPPLPSDKNWSQ